MHVCSFGSSGASRFNRPFALVGLAITVVCALAAALLTPTVAHAGTFELPRVNVQAQVAENGDLLVTEGRTFAFTDDVNGVFWDIPFAQNQQGIASTVEVLDVFVHRGAAENEAEARRAATAMSEVPMAENGQSDVYTVENTGGSLRLKVFLPSEDGDEATVWVSYLVRGAVMAWPDTAELYWQFIGSEWEEDAEDVTCTVTFAGAAAGTAATTGDDAATLRAWGHGPLDGSVTVDVVDPANPAVTLAAPRVRAGQFAEVRAAFPADWVPGLPPAGQGRLQTILDEEAGWAEEANAKREQARVTATVGTGVLTAAPAALLGFATYLRKKKYASPKPVFDETYFRDVPSDDHPAVLSALVYDGAVQDCAFIATLMRLCDDRVIKIAHESRTEDVFLGLGEKTVEEYSLELVAREKATDPIDRAALDLYFGAEAPNGTAVSFDALKDAEGAGEGLENFKAEVLSEYERRNLSNLVPAGFVGGVSSIAALFIVGAIAFLIFTDGVNAPAIFAGVALSVAAIGVASTTKKHTQEAVELLSRCRALQKWLEDFTNLDEAVPGDLILWNKLLVLAVAFGVSEEVLRQLADAVPAEQRMDANGTYYYPSYWWYYSHGRLRAPMNEMHDAYQATVSELASSSASSAGGFGGGFSGGGGGGVGGGGGGSF